jgi:transcriptional regulator with PAS, ATPase and Fis domain
MQDRAKTASIHVSVGDLSRLPAERLARMLLEHAAADPALLSRLKATLEEQQLLGGRSSVSWPAEIVGGSSAMRHLMSLVERFARTDEPVLIAGESGTGKELIAQAIHAKSRRRDGPFVAVNCAAIPPTLIASELFGYERGAFTGANSRTKGHIEHANGGTLFLDEIGDMPFDLQGHLLRFLQEGHIVRVGGRETLKVDVRVVSATNVRLRQAMAEGRFREDLFYRLNVLSLDVPPLRHRAEDIAVLARHFLLQAAQQYGREVSDFEPAALEALQRHSWPGNVRELASVVRRAVVIGDGPAVRLADLAGLAEDVPPRSAPPPVAGRPHPGSPQEREALLRALADTNENITLTAQELGVSRVTLYRMLRRHAINLSRGLKPAPIMN